MEIDGHVCEKCDRIFFTSCQLRQHNKSCSTENKTNASLENGDGTDEERSESNAVISTKQRKLYTCKACFMVFRRIGNYKRHLLTHSSIFTHYCRVCNRGFLRRYVCLQHEFKVHNFVQNKPYLRKSNARIGKNFPPKTNVLGPNVLVDSKLRLEAVSGSCEDSASGAVFSKCAPTSVKKLGDADVRAPSSSSSEDDVACVCDICLQLFDDQQQLHQHKLTVHRQQHGTNASKSATRNTGQFAVSNTSSNQPTFICKKCKKTFFNMRNLQRHIQMHKGVRPYTCEYCCYSFLRLDALKAHKVKHYHNPQYRCCVCFHKANDAGSLKVHFKEHTPVEIKEAYRRKGRIYGRKVPNKLQPLSGKQVVPCNPSKMAAAVTLGLHLTKSNAEMLEPPLSKTVNTEMSTSHSVENSDSKGTTYKCNKCSRHFVDHLKYSQHVLEHRGITSLYICNVCGKHLTSLEDYESHQRTHEDASAQQVIKEQVPYQNTLDSGELDALQHILSNRNPELTVTKVAGMSNKPLHMMPTLAQNNFVPNNAKFGSLSQSGNTVACNNQNALAYSPIPTLQFMPPMFSYFCQYCNKCFFLEQDFQSHQCNAQRYIACQPEMPFSAGNNALSVFQQQKASSGYAVASAGLEIASKPKSLSPLQQYWSSESMSPDTQKCNFVPQITSVVSMKYDEGFKNYMCGCCDKASNSAESLIRHMLSNCTKQTDGISADSCDPNGKQLLRGSYKKCITCKKQFSSSSSLLSHVCVVQKSSGCTTPEHQLSAYVCALCQADLQNPLSLKQHIGSMHHKFSIYSCPLCDVYGSKQQIENHIFTHVKKIGTMLALNESLGDVLVYMNCHDGMPKRDPHKGPAECDKSQSLETSNSNRQKEVSVNHSVRHTAALESSALSTLSVTIKAEAPTAPDSFTSESPLHPDSLSLEYCEKCDETFPADVFKKHLTSHKVGEVGSRERNVSGCAEMRPSNSVKLNNFVAEEEEDDVGSYNGIEEITIEPSLDVYNEIIEDKEKEKSLDALKILETGGSLMDHINGLVTSGDLFSERKSDKPGKQIWSIKDDKSYRCSECGQCFSNQSSFYRHRQWHQGLMKYACPHCSRLFYRKDQFTRHVHSHSKHVGSSEL